MIMPRKDVVPSQGEKQEQQGGGLPLADASWSLAQDLPLKGETGKDLAGEGPEVVMPRKDYNTLSWTGSASPGLRDAAGGDEEHEVNMPRKEVVFPEGGKQQTGTAFPLAGASWSLAQDLPLKEGEKQQGEGPEVNMPRKDAVSAGEKQQQENSSPLAGASWSLAQDLPLKGEAAKNQEEEHEVIMPRKDAVPSNGEKQEQQGGGLPLADASWSLAQDLPLNGEAAKEEEHEAIMPSKDVVPADGDKQEQQGGGLPLAEASWSLAQDLPLKEEGGKQQNGGAAESLASASWSFARHPSSKMPAAVLEGGI